ncbi:MAG: ParB/RepB/Spo0J family partition protein [Gallicola sp.]|nr:ParB/RepB/Spo0J family partition protein [Gallicola sp.]
MAKRKGLGKGLGALLPEIEEKDETSSLEIEVEKIHPRINQPRKEFDKEALENLKESILEHGVLQPILVRKVDEEYEIIAGERRFRGAKLAGLKKVPVLVKELEDKAVEEISLIENIQREDLNPIEEAEAYQQLLDKYTYTQQDLSDRLGKSRSYIANNLRLMKLDDRSKDCLRKGEITSSQGRTLLSIKDEKERQEYLDRLLDKTINIREMEKAARKKAKVVKEDPFKQDLENKLLEVFGTKVTIVPKRKGGKIEIEYLSNEDLERIINIMEG